MKTIRLTGRPSRLSRWQIEMVRQKITAAFPGIQVEIVPRTTRGDTLATVPLQTVEGSDFFTRDIFDALAAGEADIAVHSLKDMSGAHFFGGNQFAVVDRDDTRDLALFHHGILEKIQNGNTLIIGTCSPRRETMATAFLQKALPQFQVPVKIELRPIRGNIETRLRKLHTGEYDGTILATAGLNRLLRSAADAPEIRALLEDKKKMLLPLIECVPAPCQGAIVAEAHPSNQQAVEMLAAINDLRLFQECSAEKREALQYGTGCEQRFGITTLHTASGVYRYAAGTSHTETMFQHWDPLPDPGTVTGQLFSSTDRMRDFFTYEPLIDTDEAHLQPVVFVANYKAVNYAKSDTLHKKTILASGTKTWLELARKGYWVTGCADGLGFESFLPALQMPVLNIEPAAICILTHAGAAERWRTAGYTASASYRLQPTASAILSREIASADAVFWSSFSQYEFYGQFTRPGIRHCCAGGETARLLRAAGHSPLVFPTIKAFEQWRKMNIPLPGGA